MCSRGRAEAEEGEKEEGEAWRPVGGGDSGGKMKQESPLDGVAQDQGRSAREGRGGRSRWV